VVLNIYTLAKIKQSGYKPPLLNTMMQLNHELGGKGQVADSFLNMISNQRVASEI